MSTEQELWTPQEYLRIALAQMLKDAPFLGEPTFRPVLPRMSWWKMVYVGNRALGPAGCLFALIAWPITWMRPRDRRPVFAEFNVLAPNQDRRLRVLRAYRDRGVISLRVRIDGETRKCTVAFGSAYPTASNCRKPEHNQQQGMKMRAPDPMGDAIYIAGWARDIVEERMGLLRSVKIGAMYSSGGEHLYMNEVLVPVDQPFHNSADSANIGVLESILYTWSGNGDRHVIPPRYTEKQLRGEY